MVLQRRLGVLVGCQCQTKRMGECASDHVRPRSLVSDNYEALCTLTGSISPHTTVTLSRISSTIMNDVQHDFSELLRSTIPKSTSLPGQPR